nr:response regulator [Anaerolineae bacterium]
MMIRVIIVDDNDETRDGTRRLLEYEDDIEIVDFADNGLTAIEKIKAQNPDVVLMDINMPGMDGITATQRLQTEAPGTQIIIVSVQDDASYMRRAIRAGAVDFVAKPISSDELAEAIRQAYAKRPATVAPAAAQPAAAAPVPGYDYRAPSEGHVITVLGPKGGVGKTTVSVNLGLGLARAATDKKIVIMDGNLFFGDVGVFLNTRGEFSIGDLARMAETPDEIDDTFFQKIVIPHDSGAHLLIAPANPAEVPNLTTQVVINILSYLKTKYDYIIVDTSTNFDDALVGAIQSAEKLILITAPTMPALKDARIMLGELSSAGFDLEDLVIVLNMVEKNQRITADQIQNFLRHPVDIQIPEDAAAKEALNRGVGLVTLDARRVNSVRPLLDLVQLIRQRVEEPVDDNLDTPQRGRGGLFGR